MKYFSMTKIGSNLKFWFSLSRQEKKTKLSYHPFSHNEFPKDEKALSHSVEQIYRWAKSHGAEYYSFWAQPLNQKIAQKQQTFLSISHFKKNLITHTHGEEFKSSHILKGEGDGSSFPNGALRATHSARAYFIWDWNSPVFINKESRVLYIPSFLVSHNGDALDDRTIYRKAERKINQSCSKLLEHFKIDSKGFTSLVGLEQQFFIIHEKDYYKRIDLHQTERAIIGKIPPHNQQFSDHYYSKLENRIQMVLREAEYRLVQMGVPVKTRHKEVAPNQYEFCSIFQQASLAIDHNFLKQQIVEEVCSKHKLVPLWHEKPFLNLNGSGKHLNWSLNYFNDKGNLVNLFKINQVPDQDLFWLVLLIHAKALAANQQLFLSAVSVPGNQLRMGGHEAPPRILSLALGEHFNNLMNSIKSNKSNMNNELGGLTYQIMRQNEDRNRTSPYGYVSNRYEYRSVGSTQNVYFPMSIILGTLANEIDKALAELSSGMSVKELISKLRKETENIRFDGNGYSPQWESEARRRNLYVNKKYAQNFDNFEKYGEMLVEMGIYNKSQLSAKSQVLKENYINSVLKEVESLEIIVNKKIFPKAFEEINKFPNTTSKAILDRKKKLEDRIQKLAVLMNTIHKKCEKMNKESAYEAEELRSKVIQANQIVNKVVEFLPEDPDWPELFRVLKTL